MRSITDEDLVLMHYKELDPSAAAEVEAALARDPVLAARYHALGRTLAAAGDADFPEPDAALGARVWARVEPKLGAQHGADRFAVGRGPWIALAASLALAAVGIASWQGLRPAATAGAGGEVVPMAGAAFSAEGRERLLLTRVAHHLDGSQRLFSTVSNGRSAQTDLESVRGWAQRALSANRVYRTAAASAGEKRVVALLDAMEPLLIEIANAPDGFAPEELAFLQQRIDEADLLFRLRVAQKRIEQRASQPANQAARSDI